MYFLEHRLGTRAADGNKRFLAPPSSLKDFCSNDYLGFGRSQKVQSFIEGHLFSRRSGGLASRLLGGNSLEAEKAENFLAEYHKGEAALIFSTGYSANIALLSCVPQRGDAILFDKLCHASIRDGIRLSFAKAFSFNHNSLSDLEKQLLRHRKKFSKQLYVVVESLYSMDGHHAPLIEIIDLCEQYDACLIVDEAHSTGIFGERGAGLCNELKVSNRVFAKVFTYGKALGSHGAAVVGSTLLKEYLVNFARPFIYSTSPPPSFFASLELAAKYRSTEDNENKQLWNNIEVYHNSAASFSLGVERGPIQSFPCPGNENAKRLSLVLQRSGFDVRPILAPTVSKGTERLRITLSATQSPEDIKEVLGILGRRHTYSPF